MLILVVKKYTDDTNPSAPNRKSQVNRPNDLGSWTNARPSMGEETR